MGEDTFKIDGDDHRIGDDGCQECWCGYPKKCVCGGLVHAAFGDENSDGDYWLYKKCDQCGGDYEEVDQSIQRYEERENEAMSVLWK